MRVRRSRDVAWRMVGGEMLVVQLDRRMMYGLNGPAAALWEAMDEPVELDALVRVVTAVAGTASRVRRAVRAFVGELLAEGLAESDGGSLRPVPAGPPGPYGPGSPHVLWRQQMGEAPGACAFQPGQTDLCKQQPYNS